jgi:hypothetical protein
MRILSAFLASCLIVAAAPLQAAMPPALPDGGLQDPVKEPDQWSLADMAGTWDFTIGEEGPDAFSGEMTLVHKEGTLTGQVFLGGPMELKDLVWDKAEGTFSAKTELGPGFELIFNMKREGNQLVGNMTGSEEMNEGSDEEPLNEPISAKMNVAKTKAAAKRAAAIARGEVVDGVEVDDRAIEITGTDLDGVDFKLSDYRGKVVMLDFWGDW